MNNFHIGAVKEAVAEDLTDQSIVIVKNQPQNIAAIKKTANRVYVRFDYLSPPNKWDLTLTNKQKVYILGAKRITGMKG